MGSKVDDPPSWTVLTQWTKLQTLILANDDVVHSNTSLTGGDGDNVADQRGRILLNGKSLDLAGIVAVSRFVRDGELVNDPRGN